MMDVARRLEMYIALDSASGRALLREFMVSKIGLLRRFDPIVVGAAVGKGEGVASAATAAALIVEVTVVNTGCEP